MVIEDCQASFTNSRQKERPPTTSAVTNEVVIGAGPDLVVPANPNRTYLTVRNTGATDVWYGYSAAVTTLTGFLMRPDDSFDIESPEDIYFVSAGGGTVAYDEGSG